MRQLTLILAATASLLGCATPNYQSLPRPNSVELERFMGDWYVIGFIPLSPEREAHNGIESYRLGDDGRIYTTYAFNKGGFDGPRKTYHPVASVVPGTDNTAWKMQFIWPFKADYRIAYLSPDYSEVIIGRQSRDYVWLMARSPDLPKDRYDALVKKIADMGYDMSRFKRQPQRWNAR